VKYIFLMLCKDIPKDTMTAINDQALDEDALFANFAEEPTEEIQLLRKHLKKEKPKPIVENTDSDTTSAENSAQKKYIKELEEQNSKLKGIIKRMLGPQAFSSTTNDEVLTNGDEETDDGGEINLIKKLDDNIQSNPFAVVMFLNNDLSTVHRKEIEELMKSISEKDSRQDVLLAQKLQAQNSAVPLKSFSANVQGRRCNLPKPADGEDPYIVCACQYYKSFFLDRMGDAIIEGNPGMLDIGTIPTYEQVFFKALPIMEENLNVRVKQLRRCFNCDGDHNMNECPEPKNQEKINMNRAQFSANKQNSSYSQGNDEPDERFKDFKPGEISSALEEALDISLKKQLPPYIYKMRRLGYPPAFLKPLEEGLKIFGPDGTALADPDAEEGEISGVKLPEKILYPGYNAAMPDGVRDEAERFGVSRCNPEEAELYISMKRAQSLGYVEPPTGEPLAKRLKYDDDMEVVVSSDSESEEGKSASSSTEKEGASSSEDHKEKKKKAKKSGEEKELKKSKKDSKKDKDSSQIDTTTYRNWYNDIPLSSGGITYVMYTPPPVPRTEVNLQDLPKKPVTELDREPWKTATISWYDPLYGDLAAPTGTYDAIRTLLKDTKRVKRKPVL